MKLDDLLNYQKERLRSLSGAISKQDMDFLVQLIINRNPEFGDYKENPEHEEELLSRLNSWLASIQSSKPPDIRTYIEKELKKEEFDDKLDKLSKEVFSIKPGDENSCDDLMKRMYDLLNEANTSIPDYSEKRGRWISDIRGDITAVRTKGKRGSMRGVISITEKIQQDKKSQKSD